MKNRTPQIEVSRPLQVDRVPKLGSTEKLAAEPEELKALAEISHPKVTLDTSGLSPAATELANRLEQSIRHLPTEVVERILSLLKEQGR